jgi:DNA polymerase
MSLSREQMLVEMGISPIWVVREDNVALPRAPVSVTEPEATETVFVALEKPAVTVAESQAVDTSEVTSLDWPGLARRVAECKGCTLCEQRKQAVLGVGDLNPDYLFIGEGPGADEDAKGEPFVGQAGKLLDNMLAALDIARGKRVYIANAVKCRPPGNRTPEAGEMAACWPYLERQIALLKPKIIVLLGKAAVHAVLHDDKALAALRGKCFEYAGIPVVVTYHPAYLLRNLPDKSKAWEDLLFARRILSEQLTPELPF